MALIPRTRNGIRHVGTGEPSYELKRARKVYRAIHRYGCDCIENWWQQSAAYVAAGVGTMRQDLPGLIALVGFFQVPPLAAVIIGSRPGTLAFWIAWSLPKYSVSKPI